jgi:uncharacterized membrane protein YedE/YeeE
MQRFFASFVRGSGWITFLAAPPSQSGEAMAAGIMEGGRAESGAGFHCGN